MYDLIFEYMGQRSVIETGLAIDYCNALVNFLYQDIVTEPGMRLTCEAPL